MKEFVYEHHNLLPSGFPFIYHLDAIGLVPSKPGMLKFTSPGCYVHWHENIELLLFCQGKAEVLQEGTRYPAEPGDLFVISSDRLHATHTSTGALYHCLIISREFCRENGLDTDSALFRVHPHSPETVSLMETACAALQHYQVAPGGIAGAEARSAVLALLVNLYRTALLPWEAAPRNSNIRQALDYISLHYGEPITLEELAKEACLSSYHFERLFKRGTGMTVFQYLNQFRCSRAQTLLLQEGCSVSETALRCGFGNLSYFSRTFHRYTGKLPSSYKQNNLSLEENENAPG